MTSESVERKKKPSKIILFQCCSEQVWAKTAGIQGNGSLGLSLGNLQFHSAQTLSPGGIPNEGQSVKALQSEQCQEAREVRQLLGSWWLAF